MAKILRVDVETKDKKKEQERMLKTYELLKKNKEGK